MSPTVNKCLHIAVLVVVAVAGLGPVVATFAGVLPSKYLSAILAVVSFAGTIVTYLAQSPLFAPWLPVKSPSQMLAAAKVAAVSAAVKAAGCLAILGCLALAGCTGAQLTAFDQAIVAIDQTLPIACDAATVIDPAHSQTVCQVLDASGNVLATLPPIVSDVTSIGLYVTAHPMTAAVKAQLAAKGAK